MIIPIEIFNEIAKYYVNSNERFGIILSLSSEINEYVGREKDKFFVRFISKTKIIARKLYSWDCIEFIYSVENTIKYFVLYIIPLMKYAVRYKKKIHICDGHIDKFNSKYKFIDYLEELYCISDNKFTCIGLRGHHYKDVGVAIFVENLSYYTDMSINSLKVTDTDMSLLLHKLSCVRILNNRPDRFTVCWDTHFPMSDDEIELLREGHEKRIKYIRSKLINKYNVDSSILI